jgi:serine/threonine-protein kinase HipA
MRQLSLACIRLGNHGFPAPASFYLDAIKAFDEELDELMGRYASYEQLATIIRHRFQAPRETLNELFARMLFNILCGNTDDHARNHAAFWNRKGEEATQAMLILGQQRASQIALCLKAAPLF